MRCLVTGGSGFIGYHLIEGLLAADYSVRSLDIKEPSVSQGSRIDYRYCDFSKLQITDDLIEDCDVIIHLAYTTIPKSSNVNPSLDVSSNLLGTLHLLDLAVKNNIKKFIFLSSGGTVYGYPKTSLISEMHSTDPTCSYGVTKLAIEKYLRLYSHLHGLVTCSLRLANPYGSFQRVDTGQGVIAAFCYNAIMGNPIEIWGDGSIKRDFIYISDVVKAIILSIDRKTDFELNIGSEIAISLNDIIQEIESVFNRKVIKEYKKGRTFDVPINVLDISNARSQLWWKPQVSIQEGIKKTLEWMMSYYLKKS